MDEIIPNLFIGRIEEAANFDGVVISVLEQLWDSELRNAFWIPIIMDGKVKTQQLDMVGATIFGHLIQGIKVLVHCHQGIERSDFFFVDLSTGI